MEFTPFEDKEEVEKIAKLRNELIKSLNSFEIGDDEKRFILRKINHISEKLLEKARYSGDSK